MYDIGKELIGVLKNKSSKETKIEAIEEFRMMLDFTFEHPLMREFYGNRKDSIIYMKEMPHFLMRYLDRMMHDEIK